MATRTTTSRDIAAELAFLSRALKAPALLDAADRLAERAAAESWTHQEYLAACLQREVAAREAHGVEVRGHLSRQVHGHVYRRPYATAEGPPDSPPPLTGWGPRSRVAA
ncbi:hypothetical protein ACIQFZ_42450 [Streptomyces sp. NPDC093064]|uniref:hypothetical protein n=1 Tax=Streptomyces sp. NPDC093064 TaxID=3366020 RepID=UPI00382BB2E8